MNKGLGVISVKFLETSRQVFWIWLDQEGGLPDAGLDTRKGLWKSTITPVVSMTLGSDVTPYDNVLKTLK